MLQTNNVVRLVTRQNKETNSVLRSLLARSMGQGDVIGIKVTFMTADGQETTALTGIYQAAPQDRAARGRLRGIP